MKFLHPYLIQGFHRYSPPFKISKESLQPEILALVPPPCVGNLEGTIYDYSVTETSVGLCPRPPPIRCWGTPEYDPPPSVSLRTLDNQAVVMLHGRQN